MKTRSLQLFVAALFLAALSLAMPNAANARGCREGECTYNGWLGDYDGHCGPHDTECYCFANDDGSHQPQAACNGTKME